MANNDTIKHLNINSVPYDLRDDSAVNLTGNQSIDGVKTFTSRPLFNASQFATLADIGNGKLSIQGNGTTASEFTANQSGNTTLNIKSGSGITVSKSAANEITITNSGGVKYGDVLMENNPFGGRRLYVNTLYNAFANADKKYYVTITKHKRSDNGVTYPYIDETKAITDDNYFVDGPVTGTLTGSAHVIFNGSYEDGLTLENTGETYLKIRIMFGSNTSPSGTSTYWSGYPYGKWYLSFYYNNTPNVVSQARVYNKYAAHTVGWHLYNASWWSGSASGTNGIHLISDESDYQRSCVEFIVYGNDTSGRTVSLTQIDYQLTRPDLAKNGSTLTSFGPMSLYEDFTWYYNHAQTLKITASTGALTTTGDITAAKFLTSSDAVTIANGHQLVVYNANGFRKTTTTFDGTTTTKYLSQKGTFESLPAAVTHYTLGLKVNDEASAFTTYNPVGANAIWTIKPSTTNGAFEVSDGTTTKTIQLALPSLPSNIVYTDTVQTITAAKTFSTTPIVTDGSSHIAITYKADANNFTYYKDDSIVKRTISGGTPSDVALTFPSTGGEIATVDKIKNGTLTLQINGTTQTTFTANQAEASTFNVTAAALGLSQAMSFVGVSTTDPAGSSGATVSGHTTWSKGEIVIYQRSGESGYEEYIATANDNAHWELLGDADSYALKSIKVEGKGILTGGGDLSTNREIKHGAGNAVSVTSGWYKFSTDAYSHIASTTAVTSTDIFGFLDSSTGNVVFTNDTTHNKIYANAPLNDVQTSGDGTTYTSVVTNKIAKIDLSSFALHSEIGDGDLTIDIDGTATVFNANSSSDVTVNIHQPAVKRYI